MLHMHKTIDVALETDIFDANREIAEHNQSHLEEHGVKSYDFLGSIGSGKTTIIEAMISILEENGIRAGAIAGDVAGDDDYQRLKKHDIPVENLNTGKECHLDAHMVEHALEKINLDEIDVLFIENVGNLVCPADFPLGTDKRTVIISVTEGDDMVRKHPLIFAQTDFAVLNKIDLAEMMEIDPQTIISDFERINPHGRILLTDAKHGTGIGELMGALEIV